MTLGRFATLPNAMSLARVAIVPFIGAALAAPDPAAARPLVLLLLAIAFVTDWFDGRIARWTGQESEWGRILDPVADKIFVAGVAIFLVLHRGFPAWAFALLVGRDVAILLFAAVAARRVRHVPGPNMVGKIAMCVFSVALLAYAIPIPPLTTPLLWLSIGFALLSSLSYLQAFLRGRIGGAEPAQATAR
jgi:CDP-diacylglycerol--glycerol-3-phosphate 3-phosphatidyltransferase